MVGMIMKISRRGGFELGDFCWCLVVIFGGFLMRELLQQEVIFFLEGKCFFFLGGGEGIEVWLLAW